MDAFLEAIGIFQNLHQYTHLRYERSASISHVDQSFIEKDCLHLRFMRFNRNYCPLRRKVKNSRKVLYTLNEAAKKLACISQRKSRKFHKRQCHNEKVNSQKSVQQIDPPTSVYSECISSFPFCTSDDCEYLADTSRINSIVLDKDQTRSATSQAEEFRSQEDTSNSSNKC